MAKVRQDKRNGRWFIDYFGPDGRRRREYPKVTSKKAAQEALTARLRQIDAGTFDLIEKRDPSPPFEGWATEYLQRYSVGDPRATWQHRTWIKPWLAEGRRPIKKAWKGDLSALTHLVPAFRDTPLDRITAGAIEKYKAERLASISAHGTFVAPATVARELALLKGVFTRAVAEGKARTNPVKGVPMPPVDNRRSRIVTADEWQRILAELAPHLKGPMTVALFTGSRIGAVLALRRQDVRFHDGGAEISLIKTKRDKQLIVPAVGPALEALWAAVKTVQGPSALLFTYQGRQIRDYRTGWANACERAKIADPPHVHDLRRTAGTRMLEAGADLVTVRDTLGHSSVATTERYLHPAAQRMKEALTRAAQAMAFMSVEGKPDASPTGLQLGSISPDLHVAEVLTAEK